MLTPADSCWAAGALLLAGCVLPLVGCVSLDEAALADPRPPQPLLFEELPDLMRVTSCLN